MNLTMWMTMPDIRRVCRFTRVAAFAWSSIWAVMLTPACSASSPLVKMAWGLCGPTGGTPDHSTRAGSSNGRLQIWVEGQEVGSQAYSLDLEYWNPNGDDLADAWRFDAEGCQPESLLTFTYRNLHPTPQTCSFGLSEPRFVHSETFTKQYDATAQKARIHVEIYYQPATTSLSPSSRYRLAELYFLQDQTSVNGEATEPGTCGGFEEPVCFRVTEASYQNAEGVWIPWAIDGTPVTAHGDGTPIPECGATPAWPTSWGAVKATYR